MDFVFVSGWPCLDFAGTLKWRRHDCVELLDEPPALSRWALEAGLVDQPFDVDDAGLARARSLREAIYRLTTAQMSGQELGSADVEFLVAAAEAPPTMPRLSTGGQLRRTGDLAAVLSTLARDTAELIGGPDAARVRECAGSTCTRLFVDSSRGPARRWCGMNECGNRVKAANYRRRKKSSASDVVTTPRIAVTAHVAASNGPSG